MRTATYPFEGPFDQWATLQMMADCLTSREIALMRRAWDAALSRPEPQAGEAVAWSYVPSEAWRAKVLTDDPAMAQLAREMGCIVTDLFTHPREALEKVFAAGWRTAAHWMNRDDLVADIGSLAYMKDRDAALSAEQKGGANG